MFIRRQHVLQHSLRFPKASQKCWKIWILIIKLERALCTLKPTKRRRTNIQTFENGNQVCCRTWAFCNQASLLSQRSPSHSKRCIKYELSPKARWKSSTSSLQGFCVNLALTTFLNANGVTSITHSSTFLPSWSKCKRYEEENWGSEWAREIKALFPLVE